MIEHLDSNYGVMGIAILTFVFGILSYYRIVWFADAVVKMFRRRS